jgi:hypothetical protein
MPLRRGKAEPVVDTYSLVAVANLAPVMFRVSDSRVIHVPINKGNGGLGADELSMCGLSTLSRSSPTGGRPAGRVNASLSPNLGGIWYKGSGAICAGSLG